MFLTTISGQFCTYGVWQFIAICFSLIVCLVIDFTKAK